MDEGQAQAAGPAQRSVEVGVTIAIALFGLIIIVGSLDVGIGWGAEGPKSGFFPFYLGVIIIAASAVNLVEAARKSGEKTFADWSQLRKVLAITIPTTIYVAVIPWTGVYVSSLLLIAVFMMWLGPLYAVALAAIIMLAIYLTFEKWFLVPLPKGPIEDFFGL
jgi:ABC-type protease/lipase transport system fused ATPase/permease subunit